MHDSKKIVAVIALLVCLILTSGIVFFYQQKWQNVVLENEKSTHTAVAHVTSNLLLEKYNGVSSLIYNVGALESTSDLVNREALFTGINNDLKARLTGTKIAGLHLYDAEGYTVFSTDYERIGEFYGNIGNISAALKGAEISELVSGSAATDLGGEFIGSDIIATYVPVDEDGDGRIDGAFELYSDVTPMMDRTRNTQLWTGLGVGVSLALLYLVILWTGRRAYQAERNSELVQIESEKRINHETHHDMATGLPNRQQFNVDLTTLVSAPRPQDSVAAILLLNIDNFNLINNQLGFETGDRLLKSVAERLEACLREVDKLYRVGGDEFALVVNGIRDTKTIDVIVERVLAGLNTQSVAPVPTPDITASIGVALYPHHGATAADLFKAAEQALVVAKRNGKNQHHVATHAVHTTAQAIQQCAVDFEAALLNKEFVLKYQPIVDSTTRKVKGLECLVRWDHPKHGFLMPEKFIALLERSQCIAELDIHVMQIACNQYAKWRKEGIAPAYISVNLSAKSLTQRDLPTRLAGVIGSSRVPPECIEIEITESGMLTSMGNIALDLLNPIKELGVRIAMDDFGTGYSSLDALSQFPIDTLKIDRSFVATIDRNERNQAIVESVATLGKRLGFCLTAEGVENDAQLDTLRQLGCNECQGFLVGRPDSAAATTKALQRLSASLSEPAAISTGMLALKAS